VFSTRFCTLALSFCLAAGAAPGASLPAGFGTVSGRATAVYILAAAHAPAPPDYKNDGYEQTVTEAAGGHRVAVSINPSPLQIRTPFHPGRLPASLGLPSGFLAALNAALASCQRADDAVDAVLLTVHRSIRYVQRAQFEETPAEVLRRREASCVGMTRLSAVLLRTLGLTCREVVGLRVPIREGPVVLEGGALHAWLEIAYPGGPTVFCDPLRSSGWVPETYLVLRIGGGFETGALNAYSGAVIRCESHRDRVFYEPEPRAKSVLWRRPSTAAYTGTLLTGKVLGPLDAPAAGSVRLEGAGGSVSMDLWEGNFFFRDLEAGEYLLVAIPQNAPSQRALVRLNPVDRRSVLFYSPPGDGIRPGAKP
jgi:hypothetical protein